MPDQDNGPDSGPISGLHPYAERFGIVDRLPETGRPRAEILAELRTMATEEDGFWQTGQCSGTMYCGDTEHYAFLNEAFNLYSHVNALQRDICPSATRFGRSRTPAPSRNTPSTAPKPTRTTGVTHPRSIPNLKRKTNPISNNPIPRRLSQSSLFNAFFTRAA